MEQKVTKKTTECGGDPYTITLSKDVNARFGPNVVLAADYPTTTKPADALADFMGRIAKRRIVVTLDMAIHIDDPANL
jgi:hypothetical protein